MYRARLTAVASVFAVFLVLANPFTEVIAATYTVVQAAVPKNMNNLGQSVNGCSLWSGGVSVYLSPFFNVKSPNGIGQCEANDINDTGLIVGLANDWDSRSINRGCSGGNQSFGGSPAAAFLEGGDLNCLASAGQSRALGISGNGNIVGAEGDYVVPDFHAFLKAPGSFKTRLPDLPSGSSNIYIGTHNFAHDVNDAGDVIGYAYAFDNQNLVRAGPDRAVLWRAGGVMDLGTFGGDAARAVAINNAGQIIGNAQTTDGSYHAFLWQNGTMTDLGAFQANAINNAGQIVGSANGVAVIWENGVLDDLNTLIPPGSGWTLTSATAINDHGQIGGQGTFNGSLFGAQLSPDTLPAKSATLDLSVTHDPGAPDVGARFALSITNQGGDTSTGTTLVLTVHDTSCPVDDGRPCPSSPRVLLSQGSCISTGNSGWEANVPDSFWCSLGDLATGQSITGEILWENPVNVNPVKVDGTLFAVENDPDPSNNRISLSVPRTGANLRLTVSDNPDPVPVSGRDLTYTISVSNFGPEPAYDIVVASATPSGVAHVSASAGCSGTDVITCNLSSLDAGATMTWMITVRPSMAGTLERSASVSASSSDPVPANNSAITTTLVTSQEADLSLTLTDNPDPLIKGQQLVYTTVITNHGPLPATAVRLSLPWSWGMEYVSVDAEGVVCSVLSNSDVSCEVGTLSVGASRTINLTYTTASYVSSGSFTSYKTAKVLDAGSTADPVPTNNNASTTTLVVDGFSDISLTIGDNPDPVVVGQNVVYTAVITNNGPSLAKTVEFFFTKPAGMTNLSVTATGGYSCYDYGLSVECRLYDIAPNTSRTVTITSRADTSGLKTRTGQTDHFPRLTNGSNGAQIDTDLSNNNVTVSTSVNVVAQSDLSLTLSDSPDPVLLGGTVTYTLTATNNGPNTATNVTASGTLPSCSLGTLASGASASCTRTATASSVGTLSQTMSVSATETDPNAGNNSASASTTVNPVVSADMVVSMTDSPDPVKKGAKLTYNITVSNTGPSAASGVTLTDTLPANTTLVSVTKSQGSCSGTSTITCNLGSLASGASATVKIVIKPMTTGTLSNSATASASETDPNSGNNNVTVNTTVTK